MLYVPDLRTVELEPWPQQGGSGVFLKQDASGASNDCCVREIPAGGALAPKRQPFDETIYVLDGRGSTAVWTEGASKVTFEWKADALFGIPLNAWHQHFNGSGKDAARFFSVTNAPVTSAESDGAPPNVNLVADALNLPLMYTGERGGGRLDLSMAKGRMKSRITQFPAGASTSERTLGSGGHVIVMSGEGFSLMWPDGAEPLRFECKRGTMVVPPAAWRHQQFNTGRTPLRCLAFE